MKRSNKDLNTINMNGYEDDRDSPQHQQLMKDIQDGKIEPVYTNTQSDIPDQKPINLNDLFQFDSKGNILPPSKQFIERIMEKFKYTTASAYDKLYEGALNQIFQSKHPSNDQALKIYAEISAYADDVDFIGGFKNAAHNSSSSYMLQMEKDLTTYIGKKIDPSLANTINQEYNKYVSISKDTQKQQVDDYLK